jgi:hypothetical protein
VPPVKFEVGLSISVLRNKSFFTKYASIFQKLLESQVLGAKLRPIGLHTSLRAADGSKATYKSAQVHAYRAKLKLVGLNSSWAKLQPADLNSSL